jgi:quinohemoprotein ethanol dehydrogenase
MSFNPQTGLAYLPAQNIPVSLMDDKAWKFNENVPARPHAALGWNTAMFINAEPPKSKPTGRLVAWDPVAQKEAWGVEHVSPWNGGTLTTAGNLVFQGTADGRLAAYNAKSGEKLWETATGTGVVAAPATYMVDGKQYVSIAVGWGGVYGLAARATERQGPGTVYTFVVGGNASKPEFVQYRMDKLLQGVKYDPAKVPDGTLLYVSNCVFCHGVPGVDRGGNIPNLGYMNASYIENLDKFIFKGPAMERGMPDFTGKLSAEDVEKIKAFIQGTADAIRPKQ